MIRYLCDGDPIPEGEPRRYRDSRGYVRLRWHVGPNQYVEAWEHRIVAGRPSADVHHRDHNPSHNAADNLEPLSRSDHARYHQALRPRRGRERARVRAERRARRQARIQAIADGYAAGLTTTHLGQLYGLHPSQISRVLREHGIQMRSGNGGSSVYQLVDARARSRCERCQRNLTYAPRHHHHLRAKGMGGSLGADAPENVVLLCDQCHQWAHAHPAEARRAGWSRRRSDPA